MFLNMPDIVPSTADVMVPCPWVARSQPSKRTQNDGSMKEPVFKSHFINPGPSKLGEGEYARWKGYFKTFLQETALQMNCFWRGSMCSWYEI